jgi:hypothetical protein
MLIEHVSAVDTDENDLPPPAPKIEKRMIATAVVLGVCAGFPYASPAYKAAGGYPVLGIMFGGSTFIAYGAAATWGWHHLQREIHHRLQTGQFDSNYAIARAVGACAMACLSGGMNFSIAHRYNNRSLFYPTLAFVNWYGLDASGYYKIINYITGSEPPAPVRAESDKERFLKKAIMIFPIGNLVVNSYLSFKSGKELTHNDFAALPFAVLALSTFALDIFSAYELIDQVFADSDETLESQYSLLSRLLFKVMSLSIVLFATSSDAFIASDSFDHSAAGNVLAGLAIGSGFILGKYLLDDLTKQLFFNKKPIMQLQPISEEQQRLLLSSAASSNGYNHV